MGDVVGVHGPHLKQAKALIKKALREEGHNPDIIDPRAIELMATGVAGFQNHAINEEELRQLLQEDEPTKKAWSFLCSLG